MGLITGIFVHRMGDIFYGLMALLLAGIGYIRFQNLSAVALIFVSLGGSFLLVLPMAGFSIGWVLLALGVGIILWRLFKKPE